MVKKKPDLITENMPVSHSVYFNEKITNKILNILNNNMQSVFQSLESMCKTVIFL